MRYQRSKLWLTAATVLSGVLLLSSLALPSLATEADATAEASTEQTASGAAAGDSSTPQRRGLDGAKVFAWNCGSCHSERYPKERTDAEWTMIVTHMRVRANLTAEQAAAVLHYLEANN